MHCTSCVAQHRLARAGRRPYLVAACTAGLAAFLPAYSCEVSGLPCAQHTLRRSVEEHAAQRHGAAVRPQAQGLGAAGQGGPGRGAQSLWCQCVHAASALQSRWG